MKKWFVSMLAFVLILSMALPAQALVTMGNYATTRFTKTYPVYSGPGEHYYRANNGKALYGGAGSVRIYGVTGNWVLMGYGLSNGNYRIGYVEKGALNTMNGVTGNINYQLVFSNEAMFARAAAPLTDDPIVKCTTVVTIPEGTQVTALAVMDDWVYVEYQNGGKPMRGFVRSYYLADRSGVSLPSATATPLPYFPVATAVPTYPTARPVVTQAPSYPSYSNNAMLSSLKHNCPNTGIMLPAAFSPYQTTYLLTVADWVSKPTFTPTAYDPNAVITVNGKVIKSGQTYSGITMTDKPQEVTIRVQSGTASTTYTIYLQRRPSEKRTRVSAGYINKVYMKNKDWRITADLGTITYLSDDYSTGSRSTFNNKTADTYDYVVSPNCLFYYGTPQNPIRLNTVQEFMAYYQVYGSNLYTIVYIEDEIVAVMPYGADAGLYY